MNKHEISQQSMDEYAKGLSMLKGRTIRDVVRLPRGIGIVTNDMLAIEQRERKPRWGWNAERDWLIKSITKYYGILPSNILEVGSGYRKFYKNALGLDHLRGFTYPNCDYNQPDYVCEAESLPFKDETFDTAVAIHVIEHFEDTLDIINEWMRVLKVGGLLCLIVPDKRWTPNIGSGNEDPTHCHDFTPKDFVGVLTNDKNTGKILSTVNKEFQFGQGNISLSNLPCKGFEIIQMNTIDNEWSFDVILKKVKQ